MILAQSVPLPEMDRYGLPGPWQLMLLLYHVTFVLHFLFMNFAFGGAVLALVNDIRSIGRVERAYLSDLNRRIYHLIGISISFAITFGVGPLLFVQALYGQFFYTASIMIGLPWLAVVGALIIIFYLAYIMVFCRGPWGQRFVWLRIALSLAVVAGFLVIAFLLTNNHVWSIIPERWLAHYQSASPGKAGVAPDWQLLPRYAHNVVGAIASACVMVAILGWAFYRGGQFDQPMRRRVVRGYLLAAAVLTCVQIADGIAFVVLVGSAARSDLLASVKLVHPWGWRLGVLCGLGALAAMIQGVRQPDKARWTALAGGLLLATISGMEMGRQAVRAAALRPFFDLSQWESRQVHQPGAITLFLVLFAVAVAAVAWLLWLLRSRPAASTAFDQDHIAQPPRAV